MADRKVFTENEPQRLGVIWMLNLDSLPAMLPPLVNAIFQQVGPEYTSALAAALGGDTSAEMRVRFETGRKCYAAWVEGVLAAYGWVSFNEEFIGELGLRLRLLPGEAYIWDCATAPAFRRRYLYSALLGFIAGELHAENLCRVWIGANRENEPSQRGMARAGFQPVAEVVAARVYAMRQMWVQGRPGVPEALVAEARRVFLDDRAGIWQTAAYRLSSLTSR